MPRLARTVCARVPHHITQRGNRREKVFFTDSDRQAYLTWLKDYAEKYEVGQDKGDATLYPRRPSWTGQRGRYP